MIEVENSMGAMLIIVGQGFGITFLAIRGNYIRLTLKKVQNISCCLVFVPILSYFDLTLNWYVYKLHRLAISSLARLGRVRRRSALLQRAPLEIRNDHEVVLTAMQHVPWISARICIVLIVLSKSKTKDPGKRSLFVFNSYRYLGDSVQHNDASGVFPEEFLRNA